MARWSSKFLDFNPDLSMASHFTDKAIFQRKSPLEAPTEKLQIDSSDRNTFNNFSNKSNGSEAVKSIELALHNKDAVSAHIFLNNSSKEETWPKNHKSQIDFSKAIQHAGDLNKKDFFFSQNNEHLNRNSSTDSSYCLCPACSQLNVQNANNETLVALAPQEIPENINLDANINLDSTFFLHSNPLADHTVYLDFDGFFIDSTLWERGNSMSLDPFYTDLDSPEVREEIQNIWNRVSADFAPFDINVTTEEPDTDDLKNSGGLDQKWGIRVALTTTTDITNAGGGGTAYLNSFNWAADDVALVFNRGEYAASETVSHEVGHTLNLRHDGTNTRTNNPTYYEGHGAGEVSWASIMGAGFIGNDENVTTWSKGEYNDANNLEDDLSIITSTNGFGYRTDDHANEFSSASSLNYLGINPLTANETEVLTHGIIEKTDDIDYFTFETSSGVLNLDISNVTTAYISDGNGSFVAQYLNPRGGNLDISATLYDSSWTPISTNNPETLLSAGFENIALTGGTYFLTVEGVGTGDPFNPNPTGYTSYSSLGEYLINGSILNIATPPPSLSIKAVEPELQERAPGDTTTFFFTVTRIGDTSSSSSAEYSVTGSGSNPADSEDFIGNSFPSGFVNFAAGESTQTISIDVAGDSNIEQNETFSVSLSSPINASISNPSATATISNDDSSTLLPIFEETFEDSTTFARNWDLDPLTGWQRSSRRATEGNWSGELNGNVNNGSMTSQSIDLSGNYSSAKLDFDWRIQRNLDNGEFVALDISNDNGISWEANALTLQGNINRENEWAEESLDLTNLIGSEEVLIRFRGTISSSRERVNIDNVNIFATSEITSNQLKGEVFEADQNMIQELTDALEYLPYSLT